MKKPKKLLFPFYEKKRHSFLTKKWWFRVIIVIYMIAFIATPIAIWLWFINGAVWCFESLTPFALIVECSQFARTRWINGIPIAILGWPLIHYIVQIIFFKLIIDYIVLGGEK